MKGRRVGNKLWSEALLAVIILLHKAERNYMEAERNNHDVMHATITTDRTSHSQGQNPYHCYRLAEKPAPVLNYNKQQPRLESLLKEVVWR